MDETTAPGSPHDLLLRLAGRVDDDLLADARELVAVGEDSRALELVAAALAAGSTPLPPSVRAELVAAACAARIDLDAEVALAPAASDAVPHRFTPQAVDDESVVAAVRHLPSRLSDGVRLRLTWRLTPAGSAPGPLPHPVLLVETPEGGRSGEVLAYQMAAALGRSGVHAAVEVLTSGRPMPAYHAVALRESTPLDDGTPALAPRAAPSPPEVVESVVAEVVEEVTAGKRGGGMRGEAPPVAPASEAPVDLFAAEDEPAPRPVPIRSWPGGRRRRAFDDDQEQPDEQSVTSINRAPLPSPVPLARRSRPGPALRTGDEVGTAPFAAPFESAPPGPSDPLVDPLHQPLLDPLLDPISPQQSGHDETGWASEWSSGDWALGTRVDDAADIDTPVSGMAPAVPVAPGPVAPAPTAAALTAPAAAAPAPVASALVASAPVISAPVAPAPVAPAPVAPTGPVDAPSPSSALPASEGLFTSSEPGSAPQRADGGQGLLKPESLARLSDADRELLSRLQAELVAERPDDSPGGNGSGAHALREPGAHDGDGPGPGGPTRDDVSAGAPVMGGPDGAGPGPAELGMNWSSGGGPDAGEYGGGPYGASPNGGGPDAGVYGGGPYRGGPYGGGPQGVGPNGAGPNGAGPQGPGSNAIGPNSAGPNSAGPNSAGPNGAGPNGAVPSSAGPSGAGPNGPGRPGYLQGPPDLAG